MESQISGGSLESILSFNKFRRLFTCPFPPLQTGSHTMGYVCPPFALYFVSTLR